MLNVLIIAYHYNNNSIIGSVRARALVKLLPRFGWNPIVVTSCNSELNRVNDEIVLGVVHDDMTDIWKKKLRLKRDLSITSKYHTEDKKKSLFLKNILFDLWNDFFLFPDETSMWTIPAMRVIQDYVNNNQIDAIISTSHPVTSHVIASRISKKYGIPWIADFRDLWTQNHYYQFSNIRRKIDRKYELRVVRNTFALTTVSIQLANDLKKLHNKPTYTIYNGFDYQDDCERIEILPTTLEIVFTGSLYEGRRDPGPLFSVVSRLIKENKMSSNEIFISFIGCDSKWLRDLTVRYELERNVKMFGLVSRNDAIMRQKKAQILLSITWDHPGEEGVVPGKIFDYISAKRPVLHIGYKGGELVNLINKTRIGRCANTEDEIETALMYYYDLYKKHKIIQYDGDANEIEKYSHLEMVKKFVNVLNTTQISLMKNECL